MKENGYVRPKVSRISSVGEQAFGATCSTGNWFQVRTCTTGLNAETSCGTGLWASGLGCEGGYQYKAENWCIAGHEFRA